MNTSCFFGFTVITPADCQYKFPTDIALPQRSEQVRGTQSLGRKGELIQEKAPNGELEGNLNVSKIRLSLVMHQTAGLSSSLSKMNFHRVSWVL